MNSQTKLRLKQMQVLTPELEAAKLLNEATVTELTGLDRRVRLMLERRNAFPKPIRVTNKIRLYPSTAVLAWLKRYGKNGDAAPESAA